MENIYLVEKNVVNDIENQLDKENITVEKNTINEDSQYIIILLSANENDEYENARMLDNINNQFLIQFDNQQIKLLYSGSSGYFTKQLYPLLNHFEHKLRQFIITAFVKVESKNYFENIPFDLDTKDFGEIYESYFIDKDFVTEIKAGINNNKSNFFTLTGQFTKDELLHFIKDTPEKAEWETFGDGNAIPSLKKNYKKFKKIRNHVMHAHYISSNDYSEGLVLCQNINRELDEELKKLLDKNYNIQVTAFDNVLGKLSKITMDISSISKATGAWNTSEASKMLAENLDVTSIGRVAETLRNMNFTEKLAAINNNESYTRVLNLGEVVELSKTDSNFKERIILESSKKVLLVSLNPNLSQKEWDDQSLGDWVISQNKKDSIQYIFGVNSYTKKLVSIVEVASPLLMANNRIRFDKIKVIYLFSKSEVAEPPYLLKEAQDWNNQNPIKYL